MVIRSQLRVEAPRIGEIKRAVKRWPVGMRTHVSSNAGSNGPLHCNEEERRTAMERAAVTPLKLRSTDPQPIPCNGQAKNTEPSSGAAICKPAPATSDHVSRGNNRLPRRGARGGQSYGSSRGRGVTGIAKSNCEGALSKR